LFLSFIYFLHPLGFALVFFLFFCYAWCTFKRSGQTCYMTSYIVSKEKIKLHFRMLLGVHNAELFYWLCLCRNTQQSHTVLICLVFLLFLFGVISYVCFFSPLLSKEQNVNIFKWNIEV
jgi:hypothetical protein